MTAEFLIYGIKNPTNNTYLYVGQSSQWLVRPRQHLKHEAQNKTLAEEIKKLRVNNIEPVIEVLEELENKEQLTIREKFWIDKLIKDGHPLNNIQFVKNIMANKPRYIEGKTDIAKCLKKARQELNMMQEAFANYLGIALKTLRKLEQGKLSVTYENVIKIMNKLDYVITITKN